MEEPADVSASVPGRVRSLTAAEEVEPSDAEAPSPRVPDASVSAEIPASPRNTATDGVLVAAIDGDAAAVAPAADSGDDVQRRLTAMDMFPGGGIVAGANTEVPLSAEVISYAKVEKTLEDERKCLAEVKSTLEEVHEAEQARHAIEGSLSSDTTEKEDADEPCDFLYYEDEEDSAVRAIEDKETNFSAAVKNQKLPEVTEAASSTAADGDGSKEASSALSKRRAGGLQRPRFSLRRGEGGRLYARFTPLTESVIRSAWGEVVSRRDAQLEARMLPEDCRSTRPRPRVRTSSAAAHPRPLLPPVNGSVLSPPGGSPPRAAILLDLQRIVGRARFEALQWTCERIVPDVVHASPRGGRAEAVDATSTPPLNYAAGRYFLPRVWRTVPPGSGSTKAYAPYALGTGTMGANSVNYPCAMASTAAAHAVQPEGENSFAAAQPRTDGRSTSVVMLPCVSDSGISAGPAVINTPTQPIGRKRVATASSAPLMRIGSTSSQGGNVRRSSYSTPRPSLSSSLPTNGVRKPSCSLPMYSTAEQCLEKERDCLERVQDIVEKFYDKYTRSLQDAHEM
ncbi:hypothetical protein TraAM80_05553 [Trypanosoma rangeli]|uniref:Uncharacterized protein n=1 Tax=Trypanosoma rangeli TaxID=5698 RepID=A0A422NEF7_TRYRA|nr:uncharacterized protein TraAM80_05553 [Trypanosoma rangeli]RNF03809.1 hypothetical protein TraAM80_05553 [Trypanosoma rangeli]|eukprot:RNF03809.1 hypothetical protein TraAM80_05553 [Trypanosoma rangeli]